MPSPTRRARESSGSSEWNDDEPLYKRFLPRAAIPTRETIRSETAADWRAEMSKSAEVFVLNQQVPCCAAPSDSETEDPRTVRSKPWTVHHVCDSDEACSLVEVTDTDDEWTALDMDLQNFEMNRMCEVARAFYKGTLGPDSLLHVCFVEDDEMPCNICAMFGQFRLLLARLYPTYHRAHEEARLDGEVFVSSGDEDDDDAESHDDGDVDRRRPELRFAPKHGYDDGM